MKEYKLKHKKINLNTLPKFGFIQNGGAYVYKTDILDGQFYVELTVSNGSPLEAGTEFSGSFPMQSGNLSERSGERLQKYSKNSSTNAVKRKFLNGNRPMPLSNT